MSEAAQITCGPVLTYAPAHPHAHEQTWTASGKVWTWDLCGSCGTKCAALVGSSRKPCCDECFSERAAPLIEAQAHAAA